MQGLIEDGEVRKSESKRNDERERERKSLKEIEEEAYEWREKTTSSYFLNGFC